MSIKSYDDVPFSPGDSTFFKITYETNAIWHLRGYKPGAGPFDDSNWKTISTFASNANWTIGSGNNNTQINNYSIYGWGNYIYLSRIGGLNTNPSGSIYNPAPIAEPLPNNPSVGETAIINTGDTFNSPSTIPSPTDFSDKGTNPSYPFTIYVKLGFGFDNESNIYGTNLRNIQNSSDPVCYHGDSLVTILNKETNEKDIKLARDIIVDDYVYSLTRKEFVPVKLNIITYGNTHYKLIKKDTFGESKPSQDFYLTGGHPILYKGKETVASEINEADDVYCDKEQVYSIATDKREYILINNLPVMTWSYNAWRLFSNLRNIFWTNNKKIINLTSPKVELIGNILCEPKNVLILKNTFGERNPEEDIVVNENCEIIVDSEKTIIKELMDGNFIKYA